VDHKEQHHEHHRKERDREKKREAAHEREEMRKPGGVHPGWFVAAGVVLVLLAVLVWTVWLS
jgi:hypothetical protein